jgi:hypothetical protein
VNCFSCRDPVDRAVVFEGPDGINLFYCPPCAALVPDEEVPELTVNGRLYRRSIEIKSKLKTWRPR